MVLGELAQAAADGLNVGGPAIHTILLADRLRPEFETVLVSGLETEREGNMLALAEKLGVEVLRMPELGREILRQQEDWMVKLGQLATARQAA